MMSQSPKLVVLYWGDRDAFLLDSLIPDAIWVCVKPGTSSNQIGACISKDIRGLVFHVDLSVSLNVPLDRAVWIQEMKSFGIKVLNGDYTDLTKSSLQEKLRTLCLPSSQVQRHQLKKDLVIVKTNNNFGSVAERRLTKLQRIALDIPDVPSAEIDAFSYPVMSAKNVPSEWWEDPSLIIEKYIQNQDGRFFRVYVAGGAITVVRAYSNAKIKKIQGDPRDENCFVLRTELEELGSVPGYSARLAYVLDIFLHNTTLDFGAIDIMTDEQDYYITDVNTTPYGGETAIPNEVLLFLQTGLHAELGVSGC